MIVKVFASCFASKSVAAPDTAPVLNCVRYVPSIKDDTSPVSSSTKIIVAGTVLSPFLLLFGNTETIFTPSALAPSAYPGIYILSASWFLTSNTVLRGISDSPFE